MNGYEFMTNEEMIERIKNNYDPELFNQLYLTNQGLIYDSFTQWYPKIKFMNIEADDFKSMLNMYFVEAFHNYDSSKGSKFSTFFYTHVHLRLRKLRQVWINQQKDITYVRYVDEMIPFQLNINQFELEVSSVEEEKPKRKESKRKESKKKESKKEIFKKKKSTLNNREENSALLKKIREMIENKTPYLITINGETKTIEEWSELSGLSVNVIRGRALKGWDRSRLLDPVANKKKTKTTKNIQG
jgi:DNA-directed RNA polymerase specialized sigma subunit